MFWCLLLHLVCFRFSQSLSNFSPWHNRPKILYMHTASMFTPLKKQIKSSVLAIINTFNNAQQQIQTIFSADEGLGLKCVRFCLLLHVIRNNIILDCECWRFHLLLCFWVGTHNTYKTFKSSPPFLFSYYLWGKLVLQIRNHPSCTHATGYCAKQNNTFYNNSKSFYPSTNSLLNTDRDRGWWLMIH